MESNNICASEDAFEQFAHEYEGSEFITLSELVSPSCAITEVIDTIMDLPSGETGDCIVLENVNTSTFVSEDLQESNTTLPVESAVQQNDLQVTSESPVKVAKKRGRKKKNNIESKSNSQNIVSLDQPDQPDNLDLNYDMIIGEDSTTEPLPKYSTRKRVKKSYVTENVEITTPKSQRKRGRPAKNPKATLQTNADCISSTIENTNPLQLNTSQIMEDISQTKTQQKSRRGRKKKLNIDEQSSLKNVNENCDITSSNLTEISFQEHSDDKNINYENYNNMVNIEGNKFDLNGQEDNTDHNIVETNEFQINSNKVETDDLPLVSLNISKYKCSDIDSTARELNDNPKTKLTEKSKKTNNLKPTKRKRKSKKQSVELNLDLADSNIGAKNVDDDETDDLCLSKIKKSMEKIDDTSTCETSINEQHPDITTTVQDNVDTEKSSKRNVKIPTMDDFEYNIESIVGGLKETENNVDQLTNLNDTPVEEESLLEETSKRPIRRRAKKTLHYEQESDEDPFANMESSDDEPRRSKKGSKYYSDDEYIPGMEHGRKPGKFSDSEAEETFEFCKSIKKKRFGKSPRKKDKIFESEPSPDNTIKLNELDNDIEGCIETSVIKVNEDQSSIWGTTNEFENFLAKKVGTEVFIKKAKSDSVITPLQIPVLELNEPKKSAEKSTQTKTVATKATFVQTDTKNEIAMKNQVKLTPEQSEKACEFLTNIVKTTAELGQLMTQKSEDFIEKKINTSHVTDTLKMDYCVKKSFLLFKLAKHNLIQMEEDLSKQYDEFLTVQNLMQHREEQKVITPKEKQDSDSDCEIIEVIADAKKPKKTQKKEEERKEESKPAFNLKTVFLNKELSIKIAKKPTVEPKPEEKLNIKGRHTVWINDSIMVKKVKPNQSFLAQDSRNKKPPDTPFVTLKMVNDFFETYNRQKALSICAPFVTPNWVTSNKVYACHYSTEIIVAPSSNFTQITNDIPIIDISESPTNTSTPKSLLNLCIMVLKEHIKFDSKKLNINSEKHESNKTRPDDFSDKLGDTSCINTKQENTVGELSTKNPKNCIIKSQRNSKTVKSLSKLCLLELRKYLDCKYKSKLACKKQTTSETNHTSRIDVQEIISNVKNVLVNSQLVNYVSKDSHFLNNLSLQTLSYNKIVEFVFKIPQNSVNQRPNIIYTHSKEKSTTNVSDNKIRSLFSLCVRVIQKIQFLHKKSQKNISNVILYNPMSLSNIALDHFRIKTYKTKTRHRNHKLKPLSHISQQNSQVIEVKTLSSLCLELISSKLLDSTIHRYNHNTSNANHKNQFEYNYSTVLSLRKLCFDKISTLLEEPIFGENRKARMLDSNNTNLEINSNANMSITINDINTVSEDIFNNDYNSFNDDDIYDDTLYGLEDSNEESRCETEENVYGNCLNNYQETPNESNEWVSHIQMGELRSCVDVRNNSDDNLINMNQEIQSKQYENRELLANIKIEPCENISEVPDDLTDVKSEPLDTVSQIQPSIKVVAKIEEMEEMFHEGNVDESNELQSGSSYDVDAFEAFVSSNKLMYALSSCNNNDESDIYSQSCSRIRRQYEPDFDGDVDNFADNMDLLIPQTVEQAKDRLMNSSSDEESKNKKYDKKKLTKKKGKLKKTSKEIPPLKNKQLITDDVAMLTKKMKDKIRQEDKHNDIFDIDDMPLIFRKDKDKKNTKKDKETEHVDFNTKDISLEKEPEKRLSLENTYGDEIQCNDVDSTENIETRENNKDHGVKRSLRKNSKLIHKTSNSNLKNDINDSDSKKTESMEDIEKEEIDKVEPVNKDKPQLVDMAHPIELLECEPAFMGFDIQAEKNHGAKCDDTILSDKEYEDKSKDITLRNGWECYPIDHTDTKLYQFACVGLEKLPESFVETYFRYINLDKNDDDIEIDRLTNLQTLNRTQVKEKNRSKTKNKAVSNGTSKMELTVKIEPENDDDCHEFSPSEDENDNTDEMLPPVQETNPENYLAKHLLMDDNDSESENVEKTENPSENIEPEAEEPKVKRKIGPKSKCKVLNEEEGVDQKKTDSKLKKEQDVDVVKVKVTIGPASKVKKEDNSDSLLLTADRMMTSELALLHAPIGDKETEQPVIIKDSTKKYNTRNPNRSTSKDQTTTVHIRKEDDSSSEEEKQWVTTKEKLLKRLEKKQENHIDDAKRAKIISEFIEKRGDGPVQKLLRLRPRRPRSKKKLLERRKQMKVLARELFGEDSSQSRKYSQSYGKGRRNIRKVIDKKSLARNTVLANMEEFERKQRLSMRQARLRETLGCEEDVNVVVINDELCLEYDFERNQPGVTVHPYFTKVMKAHQYEGVKFMWDACFETVETVQRGGGGGGCILAHCMGLGKTLQVLALLHTVLTHPGVAMRRVLVCCPLSTVLNWVDEIHKWIGPVTDQIKVFELSKLKKTYERAYQLEDWYSGGGIFIIGYELFRSLSTLDPILDDVRPTIVNKIRTALLDPGPDIIICDEGHLLKNDMSVLAVAMSRVATKRRIVLTGTPMQNNLREYYCMVNFIKPNLLGTYPEYSNRFENPIMNGQHRDSLEEDIKLMKTRTHILHKVLEGCLQRQEASVLYPYLPKKYEYTVFISLTTCQWDLYKHYIKTFSRVAKQNVLKDFHILQKIWSHPQVLHNFQTRAREVEDRIKVEKLEDELAREDLGATEDMKPNPTDVWWLQYLNGGQMLDMLDSSNKFLVVFRLLDECVALGDKVLIFSTSLYTLDALEYFLRLMNGWSLGQQYYRLDGSVPAEVRQKWCREFNADNNTHTKLFLISTRAGCLGLNMTAANRVIILDTSWNPAHDIQSIFRVYRFGQKKDCYIYRLVALGTMEQKMYERSVTKQAVACRVVDEQQIDRHYNMAELSELYRYDEEGSSVGAGLAAGVRDAVLLRVAAALRARSGALHAVREHDSLLRDTAEARLPEHERAEAWQQFQQEHADTQMQQLAVKMPKKFRVKVNSAPNAEASNNATSETASVNPPESKPVKKRGRPPKNPPSTSKPLNANLDEDTESTIIQKIRDILIQHQMTSAGPSDIAHMIGEVRKYIESPNKTDTNVNPVIQSIAKVLLLQSASLPALTDVYPDQRVIEGGEEPETILGDSDSNHFISLDQKPSISHIISDDDSNLDEPVSERKRRKSVDEDYVPGPTTRKQKKQATRKQSHNSDTVVNLSDLNESCDSNQTVDISVEKPKGKRGRKRKSDIIPPPAPPPLAVQKEKVPEYVQNIDDDGVDEDSILDTVVNLSDLNESCDSNQTVDINIEKPKGKRGRKRKNDIIPPPPAVQKEKVPEYVQNTDDDGVDEDSILLSDDEPASETSALSKAPDKETPKKDTVPLNDSPSVPEPDQEVIPLPKSLLSDEKFIKIVAHMYVSGNPILDDDAAFLAAQYSTSRAREEVEATGKDICSGRLHEIALKVFGKESLKKLYKASNIKEMQKNLTKISTEIENNKSVSTSTPQSNATKASNEKPQKIPEKLPKLKKKPIIIRNADIINKCIIANAKSKSTRQEERVIPEPLPPQTITPEKTIQLAPAPSEPHANVVPVGMFKGPGTIAVSNFAATSREESILPDDDDEVHMTPTIFTEEPPNSMLSSISSLPQTDAPQLTRRNSKELIVSSISSFDPRNTTNFASSPAPQPHLTPLKSLRPLKTRNVTPQQHAIILKRSEIETAISNTPEGVTPTITIANGKVVIQKNILPSTITSAQTSAPQNVITYKLPIASMMGSLLPKCTTIDLSTLPSTLTPSINTPKSSTITSATYNPAPKSVSSYESGVSTPKPSTTTLTKPITAYSSTESTAAYASTATMPKLISIAPKPMTTNGPATKSTATFEFSVSTQQTPMTPMKPLAYGSATKSAAASESNVNTKQSTVTPTKPTTNDPLNKSAAVETISLDSDDEDVNVIIIKPNNVQKKSPVVESVVGEKRPKTKMDLHIDNDIQNRFKFIKNMENITSTSKSKASPQKLLNSSLDSKTPIKKSRKNNLKESVIIKPKYKKDKINEVPNNIIDTRTSLEPRNDSELNRPLIFVDSSAIIESCSSSQSTNEIKRAVDSIIDKTSDNGTGLLKPTVNTDKSKIVVMSLNHGELKKDEVNTLLKSKQTTNSKPKRSTAKTTESQINFGMIDLTDVFENVAGPKPSDPKHGPTKSSAASTPITGTSKDIFITNVGQLSTVKAKSSSKSVDLTGGEVTKVINIKSSFSGKRTKSKPETSNPTKKKKVEVSNAMKSLKDFNFDDFDDIIELE